MLQILPKTFYERSPDNVARYLLGKSLVRKFEGKIIDSMIVETEAYFGERDPASRAFNGKKRYNLMMWDEPGRLFIYNVHKYWMMNVIFRYYDEALNALKRGVDIDKILDNPCRTKLLRMVECRNEDMGKMAKVLTNEIENIWT